MNALFARIGGVFTVSLLLLLGGCGEAEQAASLDPVAFHGEDECHVCGMVIADFPGPKGQAVEKDGVRKFCSAAEMLGWWLQPENRVLDLRLYVHDMAQGSWQQPDDTRLVDATVAYYVTDVPLQGAMGAVLATFANEQDAARLAERHGGSVLRFADINQGVLQQLQRSSAAHAHGGEHPGAAAEHGHAEHGHGEHGAPAPAAADHPQHP